jgi:two-component system response regulator HydG
MTQQTQKIIIGGDWAEGMTKVKGLLAGTEFEPLDSTLSEFRTHVKRKAADLLILCVQSDSTELQQRLSEIKRVNDALPVFVLSLSADVGFAVGMIKRGVADFFAAPFSRDALLEKMRRELHLYQLTRKIFMTEKSPLEEYCFENMIGRSRKMQDNFQMIAAVSKSNATVLITGESGVGKELVAQAIHKLSERARYPFVDINCGAIPKDLLENELFGHEKGAFTGAHKRYIGSFETASHGSLFLDEISEMDVALQVKLLRVLQERNFNRIGGNDKVSVDVRIIAATNRNLADAIEKGQFREDLFYRLNVVNVEIPSLRERREDIPLLAKHFLDYYAAKNNRIFIDYAVDAMEALINYDWPGNVRELENTVERIVVLNDDSQVKLKYLPPHIQKVNCTIGYTDHAENIQEEGKIMPLEELEKQAIQAALLKFQGNIPIAAKKLKIGQATLYRKVKKFGIEFA